MDMSATENRHDEYQITCPECHAAIVKDAKVCLGCGHIVTVAEKQTVPSELRRTIILRVALFAAFLGTVTAGMYLWLTPH